MCSFYRLGYHCSVHGFVHNVYKNTLPINKIKILINNCHLLLRSLCTTALGATMNPPLPLQLTVLVTI